MKWTDTNTIHNTAMEVQVNTQNPKKNVSHDNFSMWLSSTTEKNVDQLEDRFVLNCNCCMAASPMMIFPNEKWCKWEGVYWYPYHGWSSDRQVSLRSLRGTNRNRISIVIALESFWSQESPNKETQCNCNWQIYCCLPYSWI